MIVKYEYDWTAELLNIADTGYISEAHFSSLDVNITATEISNKTTSCRINADKQFGTINLSIKTSPNGNKLTKLINWKAP